MSKAFDTIDHFTLLSNMEYYGIIIKTKARLLARGLHETLKPQSDNPTVSKD